MQVAAEHIITDSAPGLALGGSGGGSLGMGLGRSGGGGGGGIGGGTSSSEVLETEEISNSSTLKMGESKELVVFVT